jgi:SNF2 family DNA or RNA helicase
MQSRKRLHRPGQKNNVVYYHLVADKTIDAYIMKALKAKDEVVQSVLSQIKQGGFE